MYGTRFANIDELKCKLLREWAKLDHEIIASAIRQWRRRLRACETADGGHLAYLSKPSEHVRLCVEQIIVPYLGMILLNCFSKMFKIVQFYCYFFRMVKWSQS